MLADLYLRKSSADNGKSVAQQDEECTDGIDGHGWTVGRRFTDDNRSASRWATKPRESYDALVEHIRAGDCEILALWETARGGRREVTYFELLELCRDQGTKIFVYTHDRLYDLTRRSDWRSLAQEVIDSADQSAKISESAQRGKRKIAMQGKPAGRLLFGYRREYDPVTGAYLRQVEHPEQAPVIRRMAADLLAGKSCHQISRDLQAEGLKTAFGAEWRPRDVARLLRNPAYISRRIHRGEVMPGVEGDWPAILDAQTWAPLQRILSDPTRLHHDGTALRWWLTGVPRCGIEGCNGVLRVHRANGARRYACQTCWKIAITASDLDSYIEQVVLARLERPDAKKLFLPRRDGAALQAAEREAAELRGELEQWRELAKARKVSPASFADIEAGLLPRLTAAEAKERALTAPAPIPELEGVDVRAKWAELTPAIRRKVVRLLMDITILPAPVRGGRFTTDRVQIT
jgi:site-specific DNA recombinase